MLALERYWARHDRYPDSLDDLVPEILAEPIADPLGNPTFGYRLLDNDPHGRPYLLYSFGWDHTDDQGACDEDKPGAALDIDSIGVDLVINQVREPWLE